MTDIKLTDDGDISFSETSFKDMEIITGNEEIAQRLRIKLRSFLADWFLDLDDGIPYFQEVFTKNPSINVIRAFFKSAILSVEGVSSLLTFELDYGISERKLSLDFTALTESGELPIIINIF